MSRDPLDHLPDPARSGRGHTILALLLLTLSLAAILAVSA